MNAITRIAFWIKHWTEQRSWNTEQEWLLQNQCLASLATKSVFLAISNWALPTHATGLNTTWTQHRADGSSMLQKTTCDRRARIDAVGLRFNSFISRIHASFCRIVELDHVSLPFVISILNHCFPVHCRRHVDHLIAFGLVRDQQWWSSLSRCCCLNVWKLFTAAMCCK